MQILLYLKLILSIISFVAIGYLPVHFILLKDSNPEIKFGSIAGNLFVIFLSFYLGIFISSFYLMILSLMGLKFNQAYIFIFSGIFFIFSLYFFITGGLKLKKSGKIKKPETNPSVSTLKGEELFDSTIMIKKESRLTVELKRISGNTALTNIVFIFFLFLIIFNFTIVLFFALLFPIRFWDAIACWSLKGRAFFIDGSIIPFYTNHNYQFSQISYPLLQPLSQTWIYLWMGKIDENLVKIIFPLFYISLLVFFYYLFSKKYNKLISIILIFILSSMPIIMDHGAIEYTDLLFSIILVLSVYFFYFALKSNEKKLNYLMLAAAFFTILAYIRSEGLVFLILFLAINIVVNLVLLIKKLNNSNIPGKKLFVNKNLSIEKIVNIFIPLAVLLLMLVPWIILRAKVSIPLFSNEWVPVLDTGISAKKTFDFANAGISLSSELLFSAFDSTIAFFGSSFGIIWIVLAVIFILNLRRLIFEFKWIFLIFIVFGFLSLYFSLGLIKEFSWSVERYILHLLPLTYLWVFYNLPLNTEGSV
ncbi:MAG: glycosyltransferase family 39 protein [Actinobacteria bacterium]|nr:glycosyltransferase family 39 protein [Actinomycetota bacterium]